LHPTKTPDAAAFKAPDAAVFRSPRPTLAGIAATFSPVRFPSQEQLLQDDLFIRFDHHHATE
jgi:hypothetical protein